MALALRFGIGKGTVAAVTGASGFVGVNLVRALLARGATVRCLVRRNRRGLEGLGAAMVPADVRDERSLVAAFSGADVVFHSAAYVGLTPGSTGVMREINVDGTANVVAAARVAGVRRLVHVSTVYVFDQAALGGPIDEQRPYSPIRPGTYDATKIAAEQIVRDAVAGGLDATIVNPTGVIGPIDPGPSPLGAAVQQAFRGRLPLTLGGGFDWVDVRDVVEGTIAAAERGEPGHRYILGHDWQSAHSLFTLAADVAGSRRPTAAIPISVGRRLVPLASAWARLARQAPRLTHASLDVLEGGRDVRHDKARRDLGYTPRPLRETIEDLWAWVSAGRPLR